MYTCYLYISYIYGHRFAVSFFPVSNSFRSVSHECIQSFLILFLFLFSASSCRRILLCLSVLVVNQGCCCLPVSCQHQALDSIYCWVQGMGSIAVAGFMVLMALKRLFCGPSQVKREREKRARFQESCWQGSSACFGCWGGVWLPRCRCPVPVISLPQVAGGKRTIGN